MAPLTQIRDWLDPRRFVRQAFGFHPDPWQETVLDPTRRLGLICNSRQSGKTTAVVHRAVWELLLCPNSTVLILSATEAHSGEVARRIRNLLDQLDITYDQLPGRQHDYLLEDNGSRFLALPCTEKAARSFTATLILLDEAAHVPDRVWHALIGTQAATWHRASCWLLSTPNGRRGFFYDLWTAPDPNQTWTRIAVPATQCPRISPEYLEQRRRELPPWIFAQEFLCEFGDTARSVFKDADIAAAFDANAAPRRPTSSPPDPKAVTISDSTSANPATTRPSPSSKAASSPAAPSTPTRERPSTIDASA